MLDDPGALSHIKKAQVRSVRQYHIMCCLSVSCDDVCARSLSPSGCTCSTTAPRCRRGSYFQLWRNAFLGRVTAPREALSSLARARWPVRRAKSRPATRTARGGICTTTETTETDRQVRGDGEDVWDMQCGDGWCVVVLQGGAAVSSITCRSCSCPSAICVRSSSPSSDR